MNLLPKPKLSKLPSMRFEEYRNTAAIDVTGFLIRRSFRLWLLYYAVLALKAGMGAAGLYSDAKQLYETTGYEVPRPERASVGVVNSIQLFFQSPGGIHLPGSPPYRQQPGRRRQQPHTGAPTRAAN